MNFCVEDFLSDELSGENIKTNYLIAKIFEHSVYMNEMSGNEIYISILEGLTFNEVTYNLIEEADTYFNTLEATYLSLETEYEDPTEDEKLELALIANKLIEVSNSLLIFEDESITTVLNYVNLEAKKAEYNSKLQILLN